MGYGTHCVLYGIYSWPQLARNICACLGYVGLESLEEREENNQWQCPTDAGHSRDQGTQGSKSQPIAGQHCRSVILSKLHLMCLFAMGWKTHCISTLSFGSKKVPMQNHNAISYLIHEGSLNCIIYQAIKALLITNWNFQSYDSYLILPAIWDMKLPGPRAGRSDCHCTIWVNL